mmetsp:Transcript_23048/g.60208  ORF Transcript_23048/g.60208 Transcript_23048/m.60208 type:complete len:188 (-) Transcript_23048:40-603(-)
MGAATAAAAACGATSTALRQVPNAASFWAGSGDGIGGGRRASGLRMSSVEASAAATSTIGLAALAAATAVGRASPPSYAIRGRPDGGPNGRQGSGGGGVCPREGGNLARIRGGEAGARVEAVGEGPDFAAPAVREAAASPAVVGGVVDPTVTRAEDIGTASDVAGHTGWMVAVGAGGARRGSGACSG